MVMNQTATMDDSSTYGDDSLMYGNATVDDSQIFQHTIPSHKSSEVPLGTAAIPDPDQEKLKQQQMFEMIWLARSNAQKLSNSSR